MPCSVYKRLRCVFTNGVMGHCINPFSQIGTMALYSRHFIAFIGVFMNGYSGFVFRVFIGIV